MIAGRRIRLWSEEGVIIRPDERFSSFIVAGGPPTGGEQTTGITPDRAAAPGEAGPGKPADVVIQGRKQIHDEVGPGLTVDVIPGMRVIPDEAGPELTVKIIPGTITIPGEAVRVFDAQLMEESPAGLQQTGEPFWEIFRGGDKTYASIHVKDPPCNPVLVMPDSVMNWQIFADSSGNDNVNPLPYPVDGLLLFFLASAKGDIMIHGSGVVYGSRGWVFTGRSGSGKTTIARLFDKSGDRVVHDDRLILRKEGDGWVMHSTPVYRNDEPRSAEVDHLWAISHGSANVSTPVRGAEAAAMLLSNCIQQNWDRLAAARLAASVDELVKEVRVSRLTFMPDKRVRDYLTARSTEARVTAAGAAKAILDEDRAVTITAGGYSMWPAIRPGDKVIIEPLQERLTSAGKGLATGWLQRREQATGDRDDIKPPQEIVQATEGEGAIDALQGRMQATEDRDDIKPPQRRMPAAGDIVALRRDGGYVVHRVTEVNVREGHRYIRTQGDAVTQPDEPADISIIAGIVKEIIRGGKKRVPSGKILPAWLNRIVSILVSVLAG